MAEGSGGGWFGSWVSSAKNKSAEVFEFMKKDICELSSAVKTEASTIAEVVKSEVSTISEAVKESLQVDRGEWGVPRSVSSFLSQLWEPETIDDHLTPIVIQDSQPVAMTPLQYSHHLLVSADSTFTDDIRSDERAQFDAWYAVVSEEWDHSEALARQLTASPALQAKYQQLVPDKVSHSEFWKRYLFRRALMLDEHADQDRKKAKELEEADKYPWHQERFASDIELSEEEQIRILSEYEEEKNMKNTKKLGKEMSENELKVHERNDLVIIGSETASQDSTSSKESTDGDWEKEFDLD